jgi:hypothetical protein
VLQLNPHRDDGTVKFLRSRRKQDSPHFAILWDLNRINSLCEKFPKRSTRRPTENRSNISWRFLSIVAFYCSTTTYFLLLFLFTFDHGGSAKLKSFWLNWNEEHGTCLLPRRRCSFPSCRQLLSFDRWQSYLGKCYAGIPLRNKRKVAEIVALRSNPCEEFFLLPSFAPPYAICKQFGLGSLALRNLGLQLH